MVKKITKKKHTQNGNFMKIFIIVVLLFILFRLKKSNNSRMFINRVGGDSGQRNVAACNAGAYADKEAWAIANDGFCAGTPSEYGIKVYKMGLGTKNPFTIAGVAVDYSSYTMTFEDDAGVDTSFAAGTSIPLPAGGTSIPVEGSYGYAIIELDNIFKIAAQMGAFKDGTTYYSSSSWTTSGSIGKTTGDAETFEAELTSFDADNSCQAISDPVVQSGATLTGYLINSSSELIANSSASNCSGVSKIVGVAKLNPPVTITSATTGLTATFTVTDNGSSVFCSNGLGVCDNIMFDSGPFNVSFTVVE